METYQGGTHHPQTENFQCNSFINNFMNANIMLANHQKTSDQRMQELRALALEYVKQIVVRASELSSIKQQKQQQENIGYSLTSNGGGSNSDGIIALQEEENKTPYSLIDPASRQLVREAAVQINERFLLIDNHPAKSPAVCNHRAAPPQPLQRPTSSTKTTTFARVDQTSSGSIITRAVTRDSERVESSNRIEQDYATISSSRGSDELYESQQRVGQNGKASGRFKGLHDRLNWHLLVSCFSTCLPETLIQSASKQAAAATADNAHTSAL